MEKNAGKLTSLYLYINLFLFTFILNFTIHFSSIARAEETPLQKPGQVFLTLEEKEWLKAHPVIRVGNSFDYTPINFREDGNPSGYAIDVITLLAKRLNLQIEFVAETFSKQFQMIQSKELDVLASLLKTPERDKLLRLTQTYKSADAGIFVRQDEYIIQSLEDLSDKTVALTKGDANNALLKEAVPGANLIVTDSYLNALRMVASGKADATIQPIIVAGYLGREHFLSNLKIVGGIHEFNRMGYRVQEYHIAVRLDWPELAAMFDKALLSLTKDEWQELDNRWMGMFQNGVTVNLTSEEKAWLAEHPVVRVGTDPDWGPIEFRDKKGNYTGLAVDCLKKIEYLLGIQFEFVPENWQELIKRAKKQEIDIFSCVAKTPERSEYLTFTEPYITMPTGVFAKEVVSFISDINKLAGKKIAVVDGYAIHDHMEAEYSEIDLLLVKNPQEGIQAVLGSKAFAYIDNAITTSHLLNRKGIKNINLAGELDFEFAQRIGVRKDWPIFTGILQKAIDTISEAELNAMYNQWVPLTYEKPADYKMVWKILGGVLIIFIFIVGVNIRLRVAVKKQTGELSASEEKYRRLTENAKDMIYSMSLPDGNYKYVSPASIDLFGYAPEEFYSRPTLIQKIIHPDWTDYFIKQWDNLISGNMPPFYEYQIIHKSGEERWLYQRNVLICDEDDKPVAIEGIVTDITDRKLAEQRLEESEQELQTVLSSSPVGLGSVVDSKLNWCNATLCRMFGYEQAALSGKSTQILYPDKKEFERVDKLLYAGILKSGMGKAEAQCIKKGGAIFNCFIQITSVDKFDPARGQIVSMIDITDQKKAEKEREKLQDQLIQAQKMESVGRLAGGVAHDFNNMLTIILGNTEILMEDLNSENPLVSNLKEVQRAAQRSTDLTRQLLTFARKQTISPKVLNLNSTIEGMLKMLRRLIGEDINLSWHPMNTLWSVKIDPSQVDQILANLCVNARDSIKDVGKISIETDNVSFDEDYCKDHPGFKSGEYVMLTVSDTGCGMGRETLNNLFEPFFTTKESGKGTGLGLAMIYGIVKQNNGFINVYSEVDQGSNFKIYMPRFIEKNKIEKQVPDKEKIQKGHETILLVEDEKAILEMTKMMLERLGYTVLAANTPEKAIEISKTSELPIHLLMTDVVMPLMNGRDLSEKILKIFPEIRCLYMSGYTANVIAHRGILDEGLYFINKPFSRQDLSIKLRDILDGIHK